MPYKDPAKRRAYLRQKRKDPEYRAKVNAYFREYARNWRRRHLHRLRKYQREWKARWRVKNRAHERELQGRWRKRNPEKVRAQNREWNAWRGKAWYQQNKTRRRQQARQTYLRERKSRLHQQLARKRRYYLKNRDRIRIAVKQKRLANPKRFRVADRARYWRDPEKRRHQSRIARAKRTGRSCYLSLEDWKNLLGRFRFRCVYCGVRLTEKNRSLDHKTPLARGGTNDISNLVPSCLRCNQRKNRQTADEFQKAFINSPVAC